MSAMMEQIKTKKIGDITMTIFNTRKRSFKFVNYYYCNETATPKTKVDGEEVNCVTDLDGHKSSRCWVLYTDKYIYLQSYNTIVSEYDRATKVLTEEKCSITTSKQQSWFRYELLKAFEVKQIIVNK